MKKGLSNETYPLAYSTVIIITLFHLGAIYGLVNFSGWLLLAALVVRLIGGFGVGIGYHRLLVHRGFETHRYFGRFLSFCALFALQGDPGTWSARHRVHHQQTDVIHRDLHTPEEGFWWAHIGWMFWKNPAHSGSTFIRRHAQDVWDDWFYRLLHKTWWIPSTALGLSVWYAYGFHALCWVLFIPVTFGWHSTWLVNSYTHTFGDRPYDMPNRSTNSRLVAWLTFGEGWHNNHHKYPASARHGLEPGQTDMNWWVISALAKIGLVWNIKLPNKT